LGEFPENRYGLLPVVPQGVERVADRTPHAGGLSAVVLVGLLTGQRAPIRIDDAEGGQPVRGPITDQLLERFIVRVSHRQKGSQWPAGDPKTLPNVSHLEHLADARVPGFGVTFRGQRRPSAGASVHLIGGELRRRGLAQHATDDEALSTVGRE
jgi:hypothetical protein